MEISKLIEIVEGEVLTSGAELDRMAKGGFCADLMSDVLASAEPGSVLLTGLCNPQVVRTAQIADLAAVVFIRGKRPPEQTVKLANQEKVPLILTRYGMLDACGRLYNAGLVDLGTMDGE